MVRFDKFKLFGLQRTCTNLLERSIVQSFYIKSIEIGWEWKHGYIGSVADTGAAIICTVKHPFSWLTSMYRFSKYGMDSDHCPHFKNEWSFSRFLRSSHYSWATPIHRWNEMNSHYAYWVQAHPKQGILVHAESLMSVELQDKTIRSIADHFGWEGNTPNLVTFTNRVNNIGGLEGIMNYEYYTQQKYMEEYNMFDMGFVLRVLDPSLMSMLGYR